MPWGKTLIIANPAAQGGQGAIAAEQAATFLRSCLGRESVVLAKTAGPNHASEIARCAEGNDTVLALGGDGVIHEVVNGLMRRPRESRPAFGIIPSGSGNDYARTLGLPTNVIKACNLLLNARLKQVDVGRANDRWFIETLSFGFDAAIALGAMERRLYTNRPSKVLYLEAGIDQLLHHLDNRHYKVSFDGGPLQEGSSIMFAVQVGPYYGGGFKVCPDASIDDGMLDICLAHAPLSAQRALRLFLSAKLGWHTRATAIEMRRCKELHLEFDEEPPAQTDGERIKGRVFDVSLEPKALQVLVPQ